MGIVLIAVGAVWLVVAPDPLSLKATRGMVGAWNGINDAVIDPGRHPGVVGEDGRLRWLDTAVRGWTAGVENATADRADRVDLASHLRSGGSRLAAAAPGVATATWGACRTAGSAICWAGAVASRRVRTGWTHVRAAGRTSWAALAVAAGSLRAGGSRLRTGVRRLTHRMAAAVAVVTAVRATPGGVSHLFGGVSNDEDTTSAENPTHTGEKMDIYQKYNAGRLESTVRRPVGSPDTEMTDVAGLKARTGYVANLIHAVWFATEELQKEGPRFAEDWEAAGWGTKEIDEAVALIAEGIAAITPPISAVTAILQAGGAIDRAGAVSEVATEQQAHGDIAAFSEH